ncbi:MAG: hypothetical protein WCK43_08400 [bacterium]
MKCSRHFLFLFIIFFFASCGRKALITSTDDGAVAALTTGTVSLKVSLAWEGTPDKYELLKTCTASGKSMSYYVPDPSAPPIEPTPCSIQIPEGRLFFSRLKIEVEKPVLSEGCAVVKFYPYYYRKSISSAILAPVEPTKPADPGQQPPPSDVTALAAWQLKKDAMDKYNKDLAQFNIDSANFKLLPAIAKVDCSGSNGVPSKECYGGVAKEISAFPLAIGLVSTVGSIKFETANSIRKSGDGNKYSANNKPDPQIGSSSCTGYSPGPYCYKYVANSTQNYLAQCEDIYGNTLAAIELTLTDFDGDTPPVDDYCSWSSVSSPCDKDNAPF